MQVSGLWSVLWFFLLLVFLVLLALAVMLLGGVLVALVSLPVVAALPAVRRRFAAVAESATGVRPESVADWRFVAAYVAFVEAYGFALLITAGALARSLPVHSSALLVAVALVGVALIGLYRVAAAGGLRAVGEWLVLLVLLAVLTLVAAVVVPWLLFDGLGLLVQ